MKKTRLPSKKIVIAGLLTLGIVFGGGLAWNQRRNNTADTSATPSKTTNTPEANGADGENDIKQEIINKEKAANQTPPETSNGKVKVTPVITSANQSNVSAYVPGVFEEGGTCTATLKQGSSTVTHTSEGFGNASYTQCAPLDLSTLSFPSKGTWSLIVSYTSSSSEGASNSQNIEVN